MRLLASLLLLCLAGCARVREPGYGVASPDGRIVIAATVGPNNTLRVGIRHDGSDIIDPSVVGITLAGEPAQPMTIISGERQQPVGAADRRTPAYTALIVHARETNGQHRRLDLELRAYDAGAAFRLVLRPQPRLTTVRITGETTSLTFPRDHSCLGVRHKKFFNSHEGDYAPVQASAIKPGDLYDLPLTCRTGRDGETFAVTESGIEDYAAAYLTGTGARPGVAYKLTPRPDDNALAVVMPMTARGVRSPWRVIMIADRPERLIENTLVDDLAAPSQIGDVAWVKPGKAAWAWWSGLLAPGVKGVGHNDATYRYYIDFAGHFGLRYYVIDRGWAYRPDGSESPADITRSAARVHIPALVRYARARHVRLWLWVNWKALHGRMDQVLAQYEALGIAGIKADYIYRQDQEAVAFYHQLLAAAARHHLLVDLHASFVPRGLDRTYPNFLTEEGVMGAEYNKWSRKVTAGYDVRLAFTRAVIGPMDYTPGAFRNVTPAAFVARHHAPMVMTTRAHQLAQFVVYPSPLTVLADAPSAYAAADGRLAPGADFLRMVQATWNETRGVAGDWARWIAVARRHGRDWYVGVINDQHARTVTIPLAFIGGGRWRLRAWIDGSTPADIVEKRGEASAQTRLGIPLGPNGGATLVISPR